MPVMVLVPVLMAMFVPMTVTVTRRLRHVIHRRAAVIDRARLHVHRLCIDRLRVIGHGWRWSVVHRRRLINPYRPLAGNNAADDGANRYASGDIAAVRRVSLLFTKQSKAGQQARDEGNACTHDRNSSATGLTGYSFDWASRPLYPS